MAIAPLDLNLRHLRALGAVVQFGSMNAAAQAIHLSQPALTQGLAKLESQLGVTLFERRTDGVRPSDAGRIMADRAQAAFRFLAHAARGLARGGARAERKMTATQLRAFLVLADQGSFVAAARATGLSAPTLHRAVRDLEQLCGTALVERRGRGVALSPGGRRLARGVRLAVGEIEAGIADIAGDSSVTMRLRIGAMPLCRALVLPRAIASLTREYPTVVIDVIEGSWRELVEPLSAGVVDVMIGALRDEIPAGISQEMLFDDRLAVVARAGHPLTDGRTVDLAALAEFGWIVGQQGTPLRHHWESLFGEADPPRAMIECGSVMVIRGILSQSDLLTLLSADQVALEEASGMLTRIVTDLPAAVRTIGITTRTGWRPAAAQRRFLALLRDAAFATRLAKIQ